MIFNNFIILHYLPKESFEPLRIMASAYAEMESVLANLPHQCKYKCSANNREMMKNVKTMSHAKMSELKEKLQGEYDMYTALHKEHIDIDKEFQKIIDQQLQIIYSDKKNKDIYKQLNNRYQTAANCKYTVFSVVGDRGVTIKSVMGSKLYDFIICFHSHKCNYTNMFKEFCGDIMKEIKRINMILNANSSVASVSDKNSEDVKIVDKEDDHISEMKKNIAAIELDIDEDW
jgi:hypothetical protein